MKGIARGCFDCNAKRRSRRATLRARGRDTCTFYIEINNGGVTSSGYTLTAAGGRARTNEASSSSVGCLRRRRNNGDASSARVQHTPFCPGARRRDLWHHRRRRLRRRCRRTERRARDDVGRCGIGRREKRSGSLALLRGAIKSAAQQSVAAAATSVTVVTVV